MPDPLISLLVFSLVIALGALLFWPERGLLGRWQRARQMTERVLTEDALKHIHKCEMGDCRPTVESTAGALNTTVNQAIDILAKMEARDLLRRNGSEFRLTPAGRNYALHIIRAHRLWERHLADETGFAEAEWHGQADRFEHTLSPAETDALAAQLGHPTHDPHGDPIPTANGELIPHAGQPMTAAAVDERLRIVHLKDEPEVVYAQLVAEGLELGMTVRVTEISPQRVRFWASGDEHVLAPIVAANISVVPLPEEQATEAEAGKKLFHLQPGQQAQVLSISRMCRGPERRRLMDLGILPGTMIKAEMTSPSGDPTAYRIRGALIGLRKEQAKSINITRLEEATP
jgi:DtxR family Mn-dependent transcriptional regulator